MLRAACKLELVLYPPRDGALLPLGLCLDGGDCQCSLCGVQLMKWLLCAHAGNIQMFPPTHNMLPRTRVSWGYVRALTANQALRPQLNSNPRIPVRRASKCGRKGIAALPCRSKYKRHKLALPNSCWSTGKLQSLQNLAEAFPECVDILEAAL